MGRAVELVVDFAADGWFVPFRIRNEIDPADLSTDIDGHRGLLDILGLEDGYPVLAECADLSHLTPRSMSLRWAGCSVRPIERVALRIQFQSSPPRLGHDRYAKSRSRRDIPL